MSGNYNSLQAKIKEISPLADYVPCSAHSVNLVSVNSALGTPSNPFHRQKFPPWSARADACKIFRESWTEVHKELVTIENDTQQKKTVICEARSIRLKLERFETALITVFWGCLLERINATSKKLESVEIDITFVIELYEALIHFVGETRENFDDLKIKGEKLSFVQEYEKDFRRNGKRKLLPGETNTCEGMQQKNGRENFRINTF
ncbi:PREDICTED: uncharacterized protein LOC108975947 [Bactrocera latifrons]|uniref:Zinc finger MYM-type protein 1 n=1 Tax=Bactrocera latifrons TaxID=174628 RepID=A0A0K8UBL2_BACLA|nr:PREDICTED: uncharacterized protein LOC108975947 [Bactrocera latifrons]XP_018800337.1 PREDICTED: uncharacterized protein LOC108975947 [Bactrocera latifrons]